MYKQPLTWYRHSSVWLLLSGPAIVIVAGIITTWIAFHSADNVVADDYYKRGLLIDRNLSRAQAAHGFQASLHLFEDRLELRLVGTSNWPDTLTLYLIHPGRSALDQTISLQHRSDGVYYAAPPAPTASRWRVRIESADWQISDIWDTR